MRGLDEAPERLIQQAIGLFSARLPEPVHAGLLKRLSAELRFDSASGSEQAFGLRSDAEGTRQLLFFSEGRDIDIRISPMHTPKGRQWRLSGQVLGPDTAGTAELRAGQEMRQASWDELSEFSFDGVPQGPCLLVLKTAAWELALPTIDVPA